MNHITSSKLHNNKPITKIQTEIRPVLMKLWPKSTSYEIRSILNVYQSILDDISVFIQSFSTIKYIIT